MSWDVMIFSSKQKIISIEEIDEEQFVPIDFNAVLEKHFNNMLVNDGHREIKGADYSINYFVDNEPTSNSMFNLYGENALFELILISKMYGLQYLIQEMEK